MMAIIFEFNGKPYVSATTYIKLDKENKKLKSDLAFKGTMLDNVRAEYDSLQNIIKKLKAELELKNLALKQAQEGSILI